MNNNEFSPKEIIVILSIVIIGIILTPSIIIKSGITPNLAIFYIMFVLPVCLYIRFIFKRAKYCNEYIDKRIREKEIFDLYFDEKIFVSYCNKHGADVRKYVKIDQSMYIGKNAYEPSRYNNEFLPGGEGYEKCCKRLDDMYYKLHFKENMEFPLIKSVFGNYYDMFYFSWREEDLKNYTLKFNTRMFSSENIDKIKELIS